MEALAVAGTETLHACTAAAEAEEHVRAHNRPAQTGACGYRLVDILDAGHSLKDKIDCLPPQRGLQAVGDMARNLLVHADGHLSAAFVEGLGEVEGARHGPLIAEQLNQGNEMGWIEGMTQDDPARIAPSASAALRAGRW